MAQTKNYQLKIQSEIEAIVKEETEKMTKARQQAQQAHDNTDEYERVRLKCARK